jgi:hypothetical protein
LPTERKGVEHFKRVLRQTIAPPSPGEMPKPDDAWGAWVEYRLKRLEDGQQWMLRVILAALVAQFALEVVKLI